MGVQLRLSVLALCVLLLLLSGCGNSLGTAPEKLEADLSQYPHWFFDDGEFNGIFLLDGNAEGADRENTILMIEQLQAFDSTIDESLIKTYPDSALTEQNAILIGSCSQQPPNRWANLFLDCISMLPEQALVKIVDFKGAWLLLILGYDTERTQDAIMMLSDYKSYPLQGQVVEAVKEGDAYRVGLPR